MSLGAMAADMNEDHQEMHFGFGGVEAPTRGLHTPSKPSIIGMETMAKETERSEEVRGDQTRLQHRAEQRQSLQTHLDVLRCTLA